MKKILITTDFSANSKAGLRFAISLTKQRKSELIFFHSCFLPKPTSWSESAYSVYAKKEKQKLLNELEKFVSGTFKMMGVAPEKFKCVIEESIMPESGIMDYARKNSVDFICISTRGAGRFKKILGTTTGNLITQSQVPVIAIPQHYKTKNVTHILYASDLKNYKQELKRVIEFAKPFKTSIEVFHLSYPGEPLINKSEMEATLKKQFKYNIKLNFENSDLTQPLVDNLQRAISSVKPSVVIMFTEQRRTFFQKLFLSRFSESIAFEIKVPLLVFNKTT
ncbi:MAG: universal stress protein [Bacteroidota bacterium]